jgi:hypothetical protein
MSNPVFVGGLAGATAGCLGLALIPSFSWVGLILVLVVQMLLFEWVILPLGKWHVIPDDLPPSRHNKGFHVACWVILGLGSAFVFLIPLAAWLRMFVVIRHGAESGQSEDALQHVLSLVRLYLASQCVGLGFLAIGTTVSIFDLVRRRRRIVAWRARADQASDT